MQWPLFQGQDHEEVEKQRQEAIMQERGREFIAKMKKPPPPKPWKTLIIGAYLPVFVFVVLLISFTYIGTRAPAFPLFALVCFSLCGMVLVYPRQASPIHARTFFDWFPTLSLALAIVAGAILGSVNHGILEPWLVTQNLHEYNNVLPMSAPGAYIDAGIVRFAEGTKLGTQLGAGLDVAATTYCVAPVVEGNQSAGDVPKPSIGFFAVGTNCCEDNKFTCNDADNSDVRTAIRAVADVFHGNQAGMEERAKFRKAMKKAGEKHSFSVQEHPVMLVWVKDPEGAAKVSLTFASVMVAILTCIASGMTCCCLKVFRLNAAVEGTKESL